jgi:hypothetical protein
MVLTADDATLRATAAFVPVCESCHAQTRYFSNNLVCFSERQFIGGFNLPHEFTASYLQNKWPALSLQYPVFLVFVTVIVTHTRYPETRIPFLFK